VLIVTNGASAVAVLERAGIPGDRLSWDDVLHDGPVPAGLDLDRLTTTRARFIADWFHGEYGAVLHDLRARNAGLARAPEHDEVVLWFEHDLYDQLQLLQVLDWFADAERRPPRLTLICHDRYVSLADDDTLRADFAARAPVQTAQFHLARTAWEAFRAPTPARLSQLLDADTSALPFLHAAVERLLEEYPGVGHGLSRSEHQIVRVIPPEGLARAEAFRETQQMEDPFYLGDGSFFRYLERLASGQAPLLRFEDDRVFLTDAGRAVDAGQQDRITLCGFNGWLGGVRLCPGNYWRWDADARRLRSLRRRSQ
jgi:hypothetical protein